MKKRIGAILCCVIIVVINSVNAFANTHMETLDEERATNYYNIDFKRNSDTSATAKVTARNANYNRGIKTTITLQTYNSSLATYVNGESSTKSTEKGNTTHIKTFTVTAKGKYRIKVAISDGKDIVTDFKELS